jgi:hypothetical protein
VKRYLIGASLVTLMTGVAAANPTVPPAHAATKAVVPNVHILTYKVAPADEYFGKLKMSILGIRNTIKDQGLKVDADPTAGGAVLNACVLTEDALHDWEQKYPRDTWLPHALFTLERLYAKVDSDAARAKAKATMVWLVRDFPTSPQAKIGKVELAKNQVGIKPVVATNPTTNANPSTSSVVDNGPSSATPPTTPSR